MIDGKQFFFVPTPLDTNFLTAWFHLEVDRAWALGIEGLGL